MCLLTVSNGNKEPTGSKLKIFRMAHSFLSSNHGLFIEKSDKKLLFQYLFSFDASDLILQRVIFV